jgi:hypothetical protein
MYASPVEDAFNFVELLQAKGSALACRMWAGNACSFAKLSFWRGSSGFSMPEFLVCEKSDYQIALTSGPWAFFVKSDLFI